MSLPASLISGLLARGVTAVGTFLLTPIYLSLLGLGSFGWLGIYMAVAGVSAILELGLPTALTREIARRRAGTDPGGEKADLLRTFELVFLLLATALCFVIGLAGFNGASWLNLGDLPRDDVAALFWLIGVNVALQLMASLYVAGLYGLNRQPLANVVAATSFIIRGGGAVLVLSVVSATPRAFFVWQAIVSLASLVYLRFCLRSMLCDGAGKRGRFSSALLNDVKGFAVGVALSNLVTAVVLHADKVILAALVPLAEFGAYTLASQLMSGVQLIASVFFIALFPRFAERSAPTGTADIRLYRVGTQTLAALALPVVATIGWLPRETLLAWTGNEAVSAQLAPVVTLLMIAAGVNSLVVVPYTQLLGEGKSRTALLVTSAQAVVFLAVLAPLAARLGLAGAALAAVVGNVFLLLVYCVLIRRGRMGGGIATWLSDWLPPALTAFAAGGAASTIAATNDTRAHAVFVVVLTACAALIASVAVSPAVRRRIIDIGKLAWSRVSAAI